MAKATEASLAASLTPAPSAAAAAPAASQQAKGKGKAVDTGKTAAPEPLAALASASHPILESIFVHVQTNNEDSRTFWLGQGFEETETIRDYYKPNIEGPRDAWLLQRAIQI